jgi:hypothetical protein
MVQVQILDKAGWLVDQLEGRRLVSAGVASAAFAGADCGSNSFCFDRRKNVAMPLAERNLKELAAFPMSR